MIFEKDSKKFCREEGKEAIITNETLTIEVVKKF